MKILISQTASLGDVILSTAVIGALRRTFPAAELWFLCTSSASQLLISDPDLSGVISYDKSGEDKGPKGFFNKCNEIKKHAFDLVFAIQRSARVSMLLYFSGIKNRIGFKSAALPFLFTSTVERVKDLHDVERNLCILANYVSLQDSDKELRLFAPRVLSTNSDVSSVIAPQSGPYIAIFPGSLWYTKRWKQENYAGLGEILAKKGYRIIFLGAKNETDLAEECARRSGSVSLAGKTSLQDLIYIVSKASLVICNDSSSLHIASAFKIPSVAIFCATSPKMGFGPWRNPNCILLEETNLWCRPCSRHGGSFCPTGSEACMRGITEQAGVSVSSVVSAAISLLP